jgi:hypothetical protein
MPSRSSKDYDFMTVATGSGCARQTGGAKGGAAWAAELSVCGAKGYRETRGKGSVSEKGGCVLDKMT